MSNARKIALALSVGSVLVPGLVGAQGANSCFEVSNGPWYPAESGQLLELARRVLGDAVVVDRISPAERGDSLGYYSLPPRIHLVEEHLVIRPLVSPEFLDDWYLIVVPDDALQSPNPMKFWRSRGDSLFIRVGTLHGGIEGAFERVSAGWHGTTREYHDEWPVTLYERQVELTSVHCDSPPPVAASTEVALPRVVQLSVGGPLQLGQPIPRDVETYQESPLFVGRLWIDDAVLTQGLFQGASEVRVELGAGDVVRSIAMQFREPERLRSVLEQLGFAIGRPGPHWWNRTTRITSRSDGLTLSDPRIPTWTPG